jgi:hypothetical protein
MKNKVLVLAALWIVAFPILCGVLFFAFYTRRNDPGYETLIPAGILLAWLLWVAAVGFVIWQAVRIVRSRRSRPAASRPEDR